MFPKEKGHLGGTWGGTNAIATAVGYCVLEIIERDNLLKNATCVGTHLLSGLKNLGKRYWMIRNCRGLGLMMAMTLEGSGIASRVVQEAFSRGLLIFSCGFGSIRFMPPLDVTIREADLALEMVDKALAV